PYLGFISASILILSGFYIWYIRHFDWRQSYISLIGFVPLVLAYSYIKVLDGVSDRIKIQWGYFSLQGTPKGMVAPKGSMMDAVLKWFGKASYELDFENVANMGIVVLIVLVVYWIGLFFRRSSFYFKVNDALKPLLFASVLMTLYSLGLFFLPFSQDFVEDKLGFLLMFKAVGRLIWPLYYALAILAVLYLNHFSTKMVQWVAIPVIVLSALIWKWEINTYTMVDFRDKVHGNFLGQAQKDEVAQLFKEQNIQIDDFQAILGLPKLMSWTDNFISEINWSTQYNSMKISLSTGLPMVSSMLSRMSIGQTADAIELLADPLVNKTLAVKFPNKKDLLIVCGVDFPPMSRGEKFLIEISDTLYSAPNGFTLLRLPLDKINDNKYIKEARQIVSEGQNVHPEHFHVGFDDENADVKYFGGGSKLCTKGYHLLYEDTIANPVASHYIFSIWTKIDHQKYGVGWFRCKVQNKNGDVIYEEVPDTRRSNDVDGEWIRTELKFPAEKECKVTISFEANRSLYVDELLIRPEGAHVIFEDQASGYVLFNGYKIGVQ
ncbi:MAG: hypothetical protein WBO36_10720, partial [Saprospiraceae bacterium]